MCERVREKALWNEREKEQHRNIFERILIITINIYIYNNNINPHVYKIK